MENEKTFLHTLLKDHNNNFFDWLELCNYNSAIWHSSDFSAVTEECHMALLGGKGLKPLLINTKDLLF